MNQHQTLYASRYNPLLITPTRPLPKEVAVIGAGTIGPDIAYYLKSALPGIKLHLVDVVEEALKNAEKRLSGYVKKAMDKRKMKTDKAAAVLENINYTM
ncbi:MAG: 3-hydroxyacyl-CoA dehydrogenase NAD-binding domain-containing protein, partial [Desulfatiglandaceae bacterium]